jgi:triosephosphate isomerase
MHGSKKMVAEWFKALLDPQENFNNIQIVVCPPTIYLEEVGRLIRHQHQIPFVLGAQNLYFESAGAFTGETSPQMLVDMGCHYVIIGHSERRQLFAENDPLIARKFRAAYHAGLIPILCIGETREQREQGKTFEVIRHQLEAVLAEVEIKGFLKTLIAYEPVWAIGTGLTATSEEANAVYAYIRQWLATKDEKVSEKTGLLYGGSVKAANVAGLLGQTNVDGVLVGGASVIAKEFLDICCNIV